MIVKTKVDSTGTKLCDISYFTDDGDKNSKPIELPQCDTVKLTIYTTRWNFVKNVIIFTGNSNTVASK